MIPPYQRNSRVGKLGYSLKIHKGALGSRPTLNDGTYGAEDLRGLTFTNAQPLEG